MADDRLLILDTTLRDGEQSPGASMNLAEKLEVAQALKELGVDVIEAGFPIASPGDFEAVQAIARQVAGADHLRPGPLPRRRTSTCAASAVREAARPRLHVFIATSPIHREFKLKMRRRRSSVARWRASSGPGRCVPTSSSRPEDASRTELDFLVEVVEKAIAAGATTINLPDTVGYAVPAQYADLFAHCASTSAASNRWC